MKIDTKNKIIRKIIREALNEDIGKADITTEFLIPKDINAYAKIIAKENCVLAGIDICGMVFKALDRKIKFRKLFDDGTYIKEQKTIAIIEGSAKGILTGERVALNFISYLSGIATLTKKFVDKTDEFDVKILDTRKTIPNLRILDKYAVRAGGGFNHRLDLSQQVLIKDNHLALKRTKDLRLGIADVIKEAKKKVPKGIVVEIEVDNLRQFKDAIKEKPHVIMLDNFAIKDIEKAVRLRNELNKKVLVEVSGGVNLKVVKKIAKSGVDFISVGALTHSAEAIDFSLEIK